MPAEPPVWHCPPVGLYPAGPWPLPAAALVQPCACPTMQLPPAAQTEHKTKSSKSDGPNLLGDSLISGNPLKSR